EFGSVYRRLEGPFGDQPMSSDFSPHHRAEAQSGASCAPTCTWRTDVEGKSSGEDEAIRADQGKASWLVIRLVQLSGCHDDRVCKRRADGEEWGEGQQPKRPCEKGAVINSLPGPEM